MRDPMEKESYGWFLQKYFQNSQSYSKKVEKTEVNTIPLLNFPKIMVDTSKLTGKGEA